MAQQEEIVLWIDRRWLTAIEKRLNGQTLQEHMEDVLDEICNQLPEREYSITCGDVSGALCYSLTTSYIVIKSSAISFSLPLYCRYRRRSRFTLS